MDSCRGIIKGEGTNLARLGISFDMLSDFSPSSLIGKSQSLSSSVAIATELAINIGTFVCAVLGLF